ncbi:hypothetical protein FKM82_025160 [Ascaphus truei]
MSMGFGDLIQDIESIGRNYVFVRQNGLRRFIRSFVSRELARKCIGLDILGTRNIRNCVIESGKESA